MERKICPYLGLPDDAKTALSFPSEGNFCHRADPSAPVNRDHQAGYCLTGKHTACPVFLARAAAPLPPAIAVPQTIWDRARQKMGGTLVPVAVLALILTAILFTTTQAARMAGSNEQPALPQGSGMTLLGGTALPSANPFLPQAPRAEPAAVKDCPLPQGWQVYTVQPTDSLFRISTIYGVSVQALQAANCLDEQTFLAHGTSLFVPTLPTPAPTATVIVYTAITAPDTGGSDDDDKPAVVAAPAKIVQPAKKPDDGKDKGKGKDRGKGKGGGDDDDDDDDDGDDGGGKDKDDDD